jgi:hypothetical protein
MSNRAAIIRQENAGLPVVRRGARFIEFDLGGGQKRYVATIEPLHYGDEQEIDTDWTSTSGVWQHEMLANDWQVRAKSAFNGAPLVQFERLGQTVSLQPQQLEYTNDQNDIQLISAVQGVSATPAGETLTWSNGFGSGRHFSFTVHPQRLIKLLTLDGVPPAPSAQILSAANPVLRLRFVFAYSAGLTAIVNGAPWNAGGGNQPTLDTTDAIVFQDASSAVVAQFAPVRVFDAAATQPTGLVQRVSKAGPNLFVEVRVPIAWLQTASYPVTIDPTLTLQPDGTAGKDAWIDQANPTTNADGDDGLYASLFSSGRIIRSVLQFDLSSIPGVTVTAATFTMWVHNGAAHTSTYPAVDVFRILSANTWAETEATWNNRLTGTAWTGSSGCGTSATDYAATALGTQAGGTLAVNTEMPITLSNSGVEAMIAANRGILLRGQDESTVAAVPFGKSSDHATAANRPKLAIDYTAGANLLADLLAAWELEDDGNDSHGENHVVTNQNTVTFSGTSADFERSSSQMLIYADVSGLRLTDTHDWTIETWASFESTGTRQVLHGKDTGSNSEWYLYLHESDAHLYFETYTGSGASGPQSLEASTFGAVSTATLYQVMVQYDSTNNQMGIQINNGTLDTLGSVTTIFTSTGPPKLGGDSFGDYFDGQLKWTRIWKRLLTSPEKSFLYNSGTGRTYTEIAAFAGGAVNPAQGSLVLAGLVASLNYQINLPDEA